MWRSSKRRLLKGLCCMWPGKGSLGARGEGAYSTWSRQAPVTFLFLVANEKSDFCRDDSSSYIHKRRGKKIKETI